MPLGRLAWISVAITSGIAVGVGGFTFVYAKGASYLTDRPEACVNCHIMGEQYSGWIKSSHRTAAVCNDCHTPKPHLGKYLNKFSNGLRHTWAFTTGHFHEPITIKPHNREITQSRCRDCHGDIVEAIDAKHRQGAQLNCICHGSVGHPS